MSSEDVHSTRRTVLKTVGGTAVGLTITAGVAAAGHEHPDVDTDPATDVTQDSAFLNGDVTEFGEGARSVDAWFQWDFANDSGFSFSTAPTTLDSPDSFSHFVDGLDSNTDYKFRAVAEDNDDGDRGYGDTLFFETAEEDQFIK